LYGVPSDGSLASVQLNPSSLTNSQFLLTTDGARVLYLSTSLYSTAVDGSTVPVQLNAPLSGSDRVTLPVVAPHGGRGVLGVGQNSASELWSAPVDGSQGAVRLTPPFVAGGALDSFFGHQITPDGSRDVYVADADVDNVFELYSVPCDASAAPVLLNSPLVP